MGVDWKSEEKGREEAKEEGVGKTNGARASSFDGR